MWYSNITASSKTIDSLCPQLYDIENPLFLSLHSFFPSHTPKEPFKNFSFK